MTEEPWWPVKWRSNGSPSASDYCLVTLNGADYRLNHGPSGRKFSNYRLYRMGEPSPAGNRVGERIGTYDDLLTLRCVLLTLAYPERYSND